MTSNHPYRPLHFGVTRGVLTDGAGGVQYLRAEQPLQTAAERMTDRLLHWAELEGSAAQQRALKHALLRAHFTEGENPGAREVLLACAAQAGLDAERAAEVVDTGEYADAVRERERLYLDAGIHSVPAVIINDRHLIAGGQPPEVFEQALRQIAAES